MPTSQYVYTDVNHVPEPEASNRRRSQRIHRKSLNKAHTTLRDADTDINGDGVGVADLDETMLDDNKDETILLSFEEDAGNDDNDMDVDRHENNGKSKTRTRHQPSMNEIPKVIREGSGGFLSDDPLTSSTTKSMPFNEMPMRARQEATARDQISTTERLRRLANQLDSDESDDDNSMDLSEREFIREVARKRAQHEIMLAESPSNSQASFSARQNHNESDDTDKIVNHNASSSFDHTKPSSSFDHTQPWETEKETFDRRMQGHNPLQSNNDNYSSTNNNGGVTNSSSRTNHLCEKGKSNSHTSQSQSNQRNKLPPPQKHNEQMRHMSTSRTSHRKEPVPTSQMPPEVKATNIPQISTEQMNFHQQAHTMSRRETWQEEAFRSSLLDLLRSFPSNYCNFQEDASIKGPRLLATENNIDDESPHSTTSQRAASAQLNHQRLFDAASRSLARLAIASRHDTRESGRNSGEKEESPNFDPPSPRSLPAYMAVMNVCDDSNHESNLSHVWGGKSNGVFSGRSVHGRSARTLRLATTPQGGRDPSSINLYSSWTLEQLAFGSLVLAARVCSECSCDRCISGQVAGFTQSSNNRVGGNDARYPVSLALVGASLGFIATAFACLDSDIVYSVLKVPLNSSDSLQVTTVFDSLCDFAPVSTEIASTEDLSTVSTISLLALSRGFEAVIDVARHSTMDPSSSCSSYASPHDVCGVSVHGTVDTGVDKSGVGWLSALGRDLGLKLEDYRNSCPRHMRLSEIARCSYDFVLSYNPMEVDARSYSSLNKSKPDDRANKNRGNSRRDFFIDIQDNQGTHTLACRQHAVERDRVFAASATFLASMLHAGVAGWLSHDPKNDDGRGLGDSNGLLKVNNLCQKLFNIIDQVARLRRSVNQINVFPDPGDSEAICTSSLSLLLLALPKHVDQPPPVSLSTSFRQMGDSSGSIEDLLHSPLIRELVDLALTSQFSSLSNDDIDGMKSLATINATYLVSELCMVGGATLICTDFKEKLDMFLYNLTLIICGRGKGTTSRHSCGFTSVGSSLLLVLNLHSGPPPAAIVVRQCLRNLMDISSSSEDDYAQNFVAGLLRLANESYSVSSCSSSLLRALIDGNPADRARDRLSLMLLRSFDAESIISPTEQLLRLLVESTDTSVKCNVPFYITRYHPRRCLLGDMLCVCIHTTPANCTFIFSLLDDLLDQFMDAINCDLRDSQNTDSLSFAVALTLVDLLVLVANKQCNNSDDAALEKHSRIKGRLRSVLLQVMAKLELAVSQGISVDITQRALKLQNALVSLSDERFVALCITNANSSVATREKMLCAQLAKSQAESRQFKHLNIAYHDQRLAYERQIEFIKTESRITARHESVLLADERKQAEDQCAKERAARCRAEEKLDQLAQDSHNIKSRVKDLEEYLARETKLRKDIETELDVCKTELAKSSMELESISSDNCDLVDKLAVSEDKVAELLAIRTEVESELEDAYSKLIKLAAVYQRNEVDMEKYKAELRSSINTANKHADIAIAKYENTKKENSLLKIQLEEVTIELNSTKAYRADVQRMRKNAPVAYLNHLHNGKIHGRPNYSGKENSYDDR